MEFTQFVLVDERLELLAEANFKISTSPSLSGKWEGVHFVQLYIHVLWFQLALRIDNILYVRYHPLKPIVQLFPCFRFGGFEPVDVLLLTYELLPLEIHSNFHDRLTLSFLFSLVTSLDSFSSLSFIVVTLLNSVLPASFSFCS